MKSFNQTTTAIPRHHHQSRSNQQHQQLLFIALLLLILVVTNVVEGLNIDFGLFQRLTTRGGGTSSRNREGSNVTKKQEPENHHHHQCSGCGKEEQAMATTATKTAAGVTTKAISNIFLVKCRCGKVCATIETLAEPEAPQPLRLVCYCKDCRGYYNTLNNMAVNSGNPPAATLTKDGYGGVDWMCIYPRDITITQGSKNLLTTCKIRDTSPVKQVYSKCCYTPMFRFGSMSVLLNTNLVTEDDNSSDKPTKLPDVKFRIMGRQALTPTTTTNPKPSNISWSIPIFSWLWTMSKRINKELMTPMPFDDDNDDKNKIFPKSIENVPVLEGFQEG